MLEDSDNTSFTATLMGTTNQAITFSTIGLGFRAIGIEVTEIEL